MKRDKKYQREMIDLKGEIRQIYKMLNKTIKMLNEIVMTSDKSLLIDEELIKRTDWLRKQVKK